MGINLKRECSENKENSCDKYLCGYFESCIIAKIDIVRCIFSQYYFDLLEDPLSNF